MLGIFRLAEQLETNTCADILRGSVMLAENGLLQL